MNVNDLGISVDFEEANEYSQPYIVFTLGAYDSTGYNKVAVTYLGVRDLAEALKPYLMEIDTKG